jgi:hypothetical protein
LGEKADKAACDYHLYSFGVKAINKKIKLLDLNKDLSGPKSLLIQAEVKETVTSNPGS